MMPKRAAGTNSSGDSAEEERKKPACGSSTASSAATAFDATESVTDPSTASQSSTSSSSTYQNEGFQRWEQMRREWLKPIPGQPSRKATNMVKSIDPEEIIERIFSQAGNGDLPQSIPLPQMVDILADFWEADGLFD